ncbi:MAG: DUF882 domain-containing protein [Terriglobales bacterium]
MICGYRIPSSNEFLRSHSSGVAKHSLHMQAMAIDIRMPDTKTRKQSRLFQHAPYARRADRHLWSATTPSGSDMLEIPTLTLRAFL